MEKNVVVINLGSSSKKYSFYKGENLLLGAHFEKDKEGFLVTYEGEEETKIHEDVFEKSLASFYKTLKIRNLVGDSEEIVIGIRLVAPGTYFTEDHIVDEDFLKHLKEKAKEDPVHIDPISKELSVAKKLFGKESKVVAVSDSTFHSTMNVNAKNYALPKDVAEEMDLKRFGYHGISLANIVRSLSSRRWGIEEKVVVCHLGSGASLTAIYKGESVDTTMGYSPLNGLPMSSRVGDIDVGAVLRLLDNKTPEELSEIFYKKSGFLAVSGFTNDMRTLIDTDKEGNEDSARTLDMFSYSIRKYIGAFMSVMGGLDAIVFSGTIGERSFLLRERICRDLGWLNVRLDHEKNNNAKHLDKITEEGSLNVYVVHTDEDYEIMKRVQGVIK